MGLNIQKSIVNSTLDKFYQFRDIIVHSRNADGGCHVSLIQIDEKCICFDDSEVNKLPSESFGYLIFYVSVAATHKAGKKHFPSIADH
jgi:hypothetical protein